MKLGTLVIVEWLDAPAETGWGEISSIDAKPQRVRSVGWIVREGDDSLVLVSDIDPVKRYDGDCNRILLIPRGMVQTVRRVVEPIRKAPR